LVQSALLIRFFLNEKKSDLKQVDLQSGVMFCHTSHFRKITTNGFFKSFATKVKRKESKSMNCYIIEIVSVKCF
jgi:hypothetical protein